MVASTVYGFETELSQLCGILRGYGYDVVNSHIGTVRVPHGTSNTRACLDAVAECHAFLGIIRQHYGSGITHKEIKEAIRLDLPRWFVTHYYVTFSRKVFQQYRQQPDQGNGSRYSVSFAKTPVMDNLGVIDMYEDAINASEGVDGRKWAQGFFYFSDLLTFVETNFQDHEWLRAQCLTRGTP